jgi:hypothetical protein
MGFHDNENILARSKMNYVIRDKLFIDIPKYVQGKRSNATLEDVNRCNRELFISHREF